ncbi:MAG: dTMP kinase [Deltaproteobacteria bacterium HGW-Deltaproteobacteria-13]|nr:MAG: dTMP kinase [Deltaproteobacteria bacterium HGW-Deltaproteobacteria-13]
MKKFITFEGIEGSGKSTQIKLVAGYLAGKNIPFIVTQEPSGTDIGRKIGGILFNREHHDMCAETEMFLFCAARAQHVREIIMPALELNKVVLCDRYSDATYAYQGAGRGLDPEFIRLINDYSAMGLKPDLTLLFDLPVEIGLQRATDRNNLLKEPSSIDRFEREKIDFHQRIRDAYLSILRNDPGRFRLIDANREVSAIQEEVRKHVSDFINLQN